MITLSDTL